MDRERKVQQERIEFSQAVHDTTAQTAYLISLGIHRARELVGKSERGAGGRSGRDRGAVDVGHVGAEAPHRRGPHLRGQGAGTGVVVALCDV